MGMTITELADVLKGGVGPNTAAADVNAFIGACNDVGAALSASWFIDSGLTNAQAGMVMRSAVIGTFNDIADACQAAALSGYLLPDNPRIRIDSINNYRQLGVPVNVASADATQLVNDSVELANIASQYKAGTLTFDRQQPAVQLSQFEVSVDGISTQTGNALADILGYQPDADFVKRQRALSALSFLDFSKRQPYMLFTSEEITAFGRRTTGVTICWMRMHDASGYSIKKRDVFAGFDAPDIVLSNVQLAQTTNRLLADPNFQQVLSFYDWVHPGDVLATIDESNSADTLYSYQVVGLQDKAPTTPYLFNSPSSPLYLTPAQQADVKTIITQDILTFASPVGADSVSPYPAISQEIYGDPGYGWVLAGVNLLVAQQRGDSTEAIRQLAYIGSSVDGLLSLAAAGKLHTPGDITNIQDAVVASLSSYGVAQTLLNIFDGVGLTLFIAGKDNSSSFIVPTDISRANGSTVLTKILSAVDPQTATLDPRLLVASLSTKAKPSSGQQYNPTNFNSGPTRDMTIPSLDSVVGLDIIDLTTYTGITRLMEIIRTVYDFYPGVLN